MFSNIKEDNKEAAIDAKTVAIKIPPTPLPILFLSKTKKLKLAQRILLNPSYHSFFEDVELLNKRKLYQAMGVNATEKVIEPFLLEEKRRFEQIYIIVNMQQEKRKKTQEIKKELNKQKNKNER